MRAAPTFKAASTASQPSKNDRDDGDDEEEDYMSMVIEEPREKRETYTQKKLRKQRESEAKARVPSKAEREAAEAARRDAALSTSTLDPSSKGFKMMAKLGYKPGSALGKPGESEPASAKEQTSAPTADDEAKNLRARLTEPLGINFKEDRGGIGLDTEKKRKFREEVESEVKRVKADEGDFRERVRLEREERRKEGQFHAAQKVAERLDAEAEGEENLQAPSDSVRQESENGTSSGHEEEASTARKRNVKPTSQINILYRGLVSAREEKLRESHARRRRYDSLSTGPNRFFSDTPGLPTFDDSSLDPDDKLALSRTAEGDIAEVEVDEDEEDEELEQFNALSAEERLSRVVEYLRDTYHYCFWCKHRYDTAEMEGCPGLTEDDHD